MATTTTASTRHTACQIPFKQDQLPKAPPATALNRLHDQRHTLGTGDFHSRAFGKIRPLH